MVNKDPFKCSSDVCNRGKIIVLLRLDIMLMLIFLTFIGFKPSVDIGDY